MVLGSEGTVSCKSKGVFRCSLPWLCTQEISGGGFFLQHFCCEGNMSRYGVVLFSLQCVYDCGFSGEKEYLLKDYVQILSVFL